MNINKVLTLGALCLSSSVMAGPTAKVIQSVPIYETSREELTNNCTTEYLPAKPSTGTGSFVGAVLGGVIGAQYNATAAILGTLTGGVVGTAIENAPEKIIRCRPETKILSKIVGYNVKYVYNKQTYIQRLNYDPGVGSLIELGVPASPR